MNSVETISIKFRHSWTNWVTSIIPSDVFHWLICDLLIFSYSSHVVTDYLHSLSLVIDLGRPSHLHQWILQMSYFFAHMYYEYHTLPVSDEPDMSLKPVFTSLFYLQSLIDTLSLHLIHLCYISHTSYSITHRYWFISSSFFSFVSMWFVSWMNCHYLWHSAERVKWDGTATMKSDQIRRLEILNILVNLMCRNMISSAETDVSLVTGVTNFSHHPFHSHFLLVTRLLLLLFFIVKMHNSTIL